MIQLPDFALEAIERLERCGFSAYAVGGCVRDSLMEKTPADWDLTTSALPSDILNIFSDCKTIPTGLKHGTVTVIMHGEKLEITTFRIDGAYTDSRRPDSVCFTDRLADDLSRRDFTICAMAYNPRTGIADLFGGREDIERKLIRCVGDPEKRFCEDALRIMRALRFAAVFGFEIDKATSDAVLKYRGRLRSIAAERISSELNKIILSADPSALLFKYRAVFAEIMPDICFDEIQPSAFEPVSGAELKLCTRLAVFFHCICNAETAHKTMRKLKYDNKTLRRVSLILQNADIRLTPCRTALKQIMKCTGADGLSEIISFRRAFAETDSQRQLLDEAVRTVRSIISNGECFSLGTLAVRGSDLIDAGISEGRSVGAVLDRLLDSVIEGRCENKRRELLSLAAEFKNL